jgi:hypothetical protein
MKKHPKTCKIILTETQVKKLLDTVTKQQIYEQSEKSKIFQLMSSI